MRINHRIAAREDSPIWDKIRRLGLRYEPGEISVLNITEDHEAWSAIESLLAKDDSLHTIENLFSSDEIKAAEWLVVFAKGHHGYPQPEDNRGYKEITYDTSNYCKMCAVGAVQNAPFRFRAEPKANHSHFLQLNWVFDELFVRPDVRHTLEESDITGISFVPPIIHKKNIPIQSVVQMKIDKVLAGGLNILGLQPVTCQQCNEEFKEGISYEFRTKSMSYCHRIKYHLMRRGSFKFKRHVFDGMPDVVKSKEWFGSSGVAFQLIIVSGKFRDIVLQMKWRGISFEPVELVNG